MNATGLDCKKCKEPIYAVEGIISCDGFCLDSYHPTCVGLKIEAVVVWNQHPSIWWMCDSCGKMLQKIRDDESPLLRNAFHVPSSNRETNCDRKTETYVNEEIAELKEQVKSIHQTLVEMNAPREFSMSTAVPIAHSSPNQHLRMKQGSKPVACQIRNSNPANLNACSHKYWMFLTRIKNTATEDDILELVVGAVGISNRNTVTVKKLLPEWKDVSMMPFISFKVGLDVEYRAVADRASTWPKGLCFRDFIESGSLWEPPSRIT